MLIDHAGRASCADHGRRAQHSTALRPATARAAASPALERRRQRLVQEPALARCSSAAAAAAAAASTAVVAAPPHKGGLPSQPQPQPTTAVVAWLPLRGRRGVLEVRGRRRVLPPGSRHSTLHQPARLDCGAPPRPALPLGRPHDRRARRALWCRPTRRRAYSPPPRTTRRPYSPTYAPTARLAVRMAYRPPRDTRPCRTSQRVCAYHRARRCSFVEGIDAVARNSRQASPPHRRADSSAPAGQALLLPAAAALLLLLPLVLSRLLLLLAHHRVSYR